MFVAYYQNSLLLIMKKIHDRQYEHRDVLINLTKVDDVDNQEIFNFDSKIEPDHPELKFSKTHGISLLCYTFERGIELMEYLIDNSLDSNQ